MQMSRGAMPGVDVHICGLKPTGVAAGLAAWRACAHLGLSRAPRSQAQIGRWQERVADGFPPSLSLSPFLLDISLAFPLATFLLSCLPSLLTGMVFHIC